VSVHVTDGTDAVASATVTITSIDGTEYTGTTGSAGGCTISNVPEGNYTVKATAENYNEYTASNIVIDSENTTLRITMTK
jgi:lipopolysaccharide export system protein LptA